MSIRFSPLRFIARTLAVAATFLVLTAAIYSYDVFVNNRFRTIDEGLVYKSGVMEIGKLEDTVNELGIRTIIDFRNLKREDANREGMSTRESIAQESALADEMGISYYNIPSDQVPGKIQHKQFLEIMDDPGSYPVLMHCYHGKGRAEIYSAIYAIEFMDYTNEEAIDNTRLMPVEYTGFAADEPKGRYLLDYISRDEETRG